MHIPLTPVRCLYRAVDLYGSKEGVVCGTHRFTYAEFGERCERLAAALERAKEIGGSVRDKAVAGAKAADEAVHEHPYQAIAIGVGVGAILGFLLARRCARNCD